jgi:hypothetical protein
MTDPINLNDARSRVDIVGARRKEIAQRRKEISALQKALTQETNDMYYEDRELEAAENAIRKLMEKKK